MSPCNGNFLVVLQKQKTLHHSFRVYAQNGILCFTLNVIHDLYFSLSCSSAWTLLDHWPRVRPPWVPTVRIPLLPLGPPSLYCTTSDPWSVTLFVQNTRPTIFLEDLAQLKKNIPRCLFWECLAHIVFMKQKWPLLLPVMNILTFARTAVLFFPQSIPL